MSLESVFRALESICRTPEPPSTRIYIYNESLFLVKPLKRHHAVSTGSFIQLRQIEKYKPFAGYLAPTVKDTEHFVLTEAEFVHFGAIFSLTLSKWSIQSSSTSSR